MEPQRKDGELPRPIVLVEERRRLGGDQKIAVQVLGVAGHERQPEAVVDDTFQDGGFEHTTTAKLVRLRDQGLKSSPQISDEANLDRQSGLGRDREEGDQGDDGSRSTPRPADAALRKDALR